MTEFTPPVTAAIVESRRHRRWQSDTAISQLYRFIIVGGASNILYVAAFLILRDDGELVANAAGAITSTVMATELHRRLTFRAAGRVGWFTAQWESGGLALIGLGATSAAIAVLGMAFPTANDAVAAALVVAVTGVVGGLRFLALRGLVF